MIIGETNCVLINWRFCKLLRTVNLTKCRHNVLFSTLQLRKFGSHGYTMSAWWQIFKKMNHEFMRNIYVCMLSIQSVHITYWWSYTGSSCFIVWMIQCMTPMIRCVRLIWVKVISTTLNFISYLLLTCIDLKDKGGLKLFLKNSYSLNCIDKTIFSIHQ